MKFYGNFGPYFGHLLRQIIYDTGLGVRNFASEDDNTEDMKRLDLGITSGLGTAIQIDENFGLTLEIRNSVGLLNTSKLEIVDDGTIKTNNTSFLIGIKVWLGLNRSNDHFKVCEYGSNQCESST